MVDWKVDHLDVMRVVMMAARMEKKWADVMEISKAVQMAH